MVSRLPRPSPAPCRLGFWLNLSYCLFFGADYFPGYSAFAAQSIEAHREARRQAGANIAPDANRTLEEQLLAVQARLQPAHRMLRRQQPAGAQVLAALWPGETIPRTQAELPTG